MDKKTIKFSWSGHALEFPEHEVPAWAEDYVRRTYLLRDGEGKPCETLHEAFVRVVDFVGSDQRLSVAKQDALLKLMEVGVFYPNVVFFMNAGTSVKNLAPCYSIKLEDSMESIASSFALAMDIQTKGGGLGIDFSPLRAKGALVRCNKGEASGPCNFIRLFNAITDTVKAGGRRRGANIGVLDCEHPDIEEFIALKDNPQELENFNLSVRVDDEFMKSVSVLPFGLPAKKKKELFDSICKRAWKTGDPGMLFDTALNRDNPDPDSGRITNGNPCGEVLAPSPFACNLASIDVSKFVDSDGSFMWSAFCIVVELGCYFLSAALDAGCYVSEEIQLRMKKMRLVGLGIMGFADLLLKREIKYGSQESLAEAVELGEIMQETARAALPESGSRLAFAPTGTLAALAGCSSGIEPNIAWQYTKKILTTNEEVEVTHPLVEKHRGSPDVLPDYFVTAHDVSPEDHVKVAAAFQDYVDGGISKTVNLRNDATMEDVREVFLLAWKLGCKGITVYRDGCRDDQTIKVAHEGKLVSKPVRGLTAGADALEAIDALGVYATTGVPVETGRRRLPETRPGLTHKFEVGGQEGYLRTGTHDTGELAEIFTNVAKTGTLTRGLMDCFAIAISLCLQYDVPLALLVKKFTHQRFEPSGITASREIPFATSIVDYLFKWLDRHYGESKVEEVVHGDVCPECGSRLIHESECARCSACGYNKCG